MVGRILALDQGTTSTRAILFDSRLTIVSIAQQEFRQSYPEPGWVEHDPEEIWRTALSTMREALAKARLSASELVGLGIANQRETTLVWDRATGSPIYNAIVWQDRRTLDVCARLRAEGHEAMVTAKTGLLLDPYFSATKCSWILDRVTGARTRAEAGALAFGTIDSFLIWRLTGGAVHVTDATNASRTLLFNIHTGEWDEDLCRLFGVPTALLPRVRDSAADFGAVVSEALGGRVAIRGIAGDQQAACLGQACFSPGMMKSTYGTGCFALLNTGAAPVLSRNRLLATIAYQLNGRRTYALEGSIFVAGAVVQWLRDALGLIATSSAVDALAGAADPSQALYLVPAFVGLGAPYWDPEARGAIYGLTLAAGKNELARAALESVGYQTRELLEAMRKDWPEGGRTSLRVDGGMTASNWTMQFLADILGAPIDRPSVMETTALGAAYLCALAAGISPGPEEAPPIWSLDRRFEPNLDPATREEKWRGWRRAVEKTLTQELRRPEVAG